MKWKFVVLQLLACVMSLAAESAQERGKRLVYECLDALGGDRYLNMQNRVESGRAYSFYHDDLTGLTIAKIYVRYESGVKDTAHELAVRERENFGKKEDFGVLFTDKDAWDITFRGARPLKEEQFTRYKETTLRDIFYILRMRLKEPGMVFESRGADVLQNAPVELVDITDAGNLTTTVYFHRTTKVPVRQIIYRRNPVTKERDQDITLYTKYRDVGGVQWPYAIERHRNGEKIFEIFSESVQVNDKKVPDNLFLLPSTIKLLKPE